MSSASHSRCVISDELCARLNLIGESSAFCGSVAAIGRCANNDATVLIQGETGTGKELAARAVHYLGARRDHPFVPVNCGALPESLLESELFGHQRGAFTGAVADSPGLMRLAQRGTLFLDEVDSLSAKAQVSLLRFLQDRRYRPLGARREEEADVRIVAACNRNLEALIRSGDFRADLYYRLKLLSVTLPPLRARGSDAVLLAKHFAQVCAQRYELPNRYIDACTLEWLPHYSWPGNVRELENLVHSHFLLSDDDAIRFDSPAAQKAAQFQEMAPPDATVMPEYAQAKEQAMAAFDRHYLTRLLAQTGGNVTRAARLAGKERRALGKLIKRYKLSAANS